MKRVFGAMLVVWPFVGLAVLAGREVLLAFGITAAVVASVFGGVYLLSSGK